MRKIAKPASIQILSRAKRFIQLLFFYNQITMLQNLIFGTTKTRAKFRTGFTPTPTSASRHLIFSWIVNHIRYSEVSSCPPHVSALQKKITPKLAWGFTLIEILVSVGLFVVIMVIALGTLVAVAGADKKAQAIVTTVNNLDFALDSITRTVMTGSHYHCTDESGDTWIDRGDITIPADCNSQGSSYIALLDQSGLNRIVFWFSSNCNATSQTGCIEKSTDGGATWVPLTSSEVVLDDARFFVIGAPPSSLENPPMQPKVLMRVTAHYQIGATRTIVHMQTTLTERAYNDDN